MKRFLFSVAVCLMTVMTACAQMKSAPKWASKMQKAIFSLVSYDREGKMLKSGTGFYIGENGEAIADFSLFKNAYSAVAIGMDGKKYDVKRILGADNSYSLVRFRVDTKKNTAFQISDTPASKDEVLYVLSFSKEKIRVCPFVTVTDTSSVQNKYVYYTLAEKLDSQYIGSPVMSEDGRIVGVLQQPFGDKGYAVDINFKNELNIQAIPSGSATLALDKIYINKALPESMEEALVYLYFKSRKADNDEYIDMLNLFVSTYPENPEGYLRRSTPLMDMLKFDEADADLQEYLRLSTDKAQANANVAQAIHTKLVYQPEHAYEKWNFDVALKYINTAIDIEKQNMPDSQGTIATDSVDENKKARFLDFMLQKSRILLSNKNYDEAIALYDELNKGELRSPALLYASALAHAEKGDSVSVQIELLDSAIAMFGARLPSEAASYVLHRGKLYEQTGRYREAVLDYNQFYILNHGKVNASFFYDRSKLEIKARMYQQALDDINMAIGIAPDNALYNIERGALMLRVGNLEECIKSAQNCIRIDPNYAAAYRVLGYAQLQQGNKDEARKNLERAKELGDENAQDIIDSYLE